METQKAVEALSALAQEARLSIFRLLVQAGKSGMAAGEISTTLQIPPSTLSFHLKNLQHAELIVSQQESRFIYYAANYDAMNALLGYLTDNCCAGQHDCCVENSCAPSEPIQQLHSIQESN